MIYMQHKGNFDSLLLEQVVINGKIMN